MFFFKQTQKAVFHAVELKLQDKLTVYNWYLNDMKKFKRILVLKKEISFIIYCGKNKYSTRRINPILNFKDFKINHFDG